MATTRRRILQVLRSRAGCTEQELRRRLRPSGVLTFDEEVAHQTEVDRALQSLKQEHRIWPTTTAATDKGRRRYWVITTKGMKS